MKVLGIDIGGSGMKGAIVDVKQGLMVSDRFRLETPQPATPKAMAHTFQDIVEQFKWKGIIGCGFPAALQNGIVLTASNIDKKWIGTDAAQLFTKASGRPTKVVNDADAAGLAEITHGAGKGQNGVVMLLTVGTGIGSAIFLNGKLVPNTELGHVLLHGNIAEKYASDSARRRNKLDWNEWGKRFNEYLTYVERLFYPNLIIVGGGISKKFKKYSDQITINAPVVPATLKNQAGIIGAAMAAVQE